MTTPTKTAFLNDTRRAEVIADLNRALAHTIDLSLAAKQAHWNIHGHNFEGLHELFDVIAVEAREYSDLMAERLVAMGGTAHGTTQDVGKGSSLEPFPTDETKWEPLTRALYERMAAVAKTIGEMASHTEDDLATQDIYIEIIRGLEKRAWMVRAHLD